MGGKSGKPTIGYWYDMDVLATACLKVDEVVEFKFADRSAWLGSMTESGTIAIYKDDLFGGEEREGGVFGQVDVMMGEPTQPVNEFLGSSMRASGIAGPVPAYRNSVNFFFRGVTSADPEFPASGVFIGEAAEPPPSTVPSFTSKPKSQPKAFRWSAMNPYFKPFKVKVRRFTKDWHPEIAKISVSSTATVIPANTTWDYCQFPHSVAVGSVNPESKTPPPVGGGGYTWFNGPATIGWNSSGSYPSMLPAHGNVASWIIKTINVPTDANTITFSGYAENAGYLYIDGEYVYSNNPTNYQPSTNAPFVYSTKISSGVHTIAVLLTNELGSGGSSTDDISFSTSIEMSNSSTDMNPAHIIRECITDTDWGLGWPTSEIDDASFFAAATTLYSEKFGLSFKWSQQMTIEDFIMMVLRHINGVLYQDRVTGKFKLKLIRNDYLIGDLVELNPNNANLESLSRAISGEMVNIINLTYSKPDGGVDTIAVHDISSMDVQGPISQDVEMLGIRSPALAARVAQRELESRIKPIAKISITTNRVGSNFHEGGLFKLNWPDQGISAMACRIVTIDTGNLTDNQIRIDAVQDVFGLPTTSYITPQTTTWVDPTSQPQAAPVRVVTETPYYEIARRLTESELAYLDETDCYIDVFASEPSSDAIDFNLWSASGSSELINRSTGTHAAMTTLAAPAVMEELSVLNLTNARGIAYAIESENAYVTIGPEYAKVVDYDVSANTITVNRGVLDTTIMTHAAGTIVILADSSAASDEISYLPDEVVSVKVQTRTARGVLPIDSAPVNTYTINQRQARPYPPGQVRVNGVAYPETISMGSGLNLTWKHRNRLTQTASIIDQATGTITPEVGTEYELRIYGDTDTLLRTETLTGESFNYTTILEAADGGGSLVDTTLRVDPWWDKTTLLLNMNGANASTTFTDSSPNFATVVGDARVSTAQSKFGGASLKLDGSGDYIAYIDSDAFAFGSGDFTIEAWVYGDFTTNVYRPIYSQQSSISSDSNRSIFVYTSTGSVKPKSWMFFDFTTAENVVVGVADVPPDNTWFHVAVTKQGSNYKFFRDGVQIGTTQVSTNTIQNVSGSVRIGAARLAGAYAYFSGYIDDLRITKGVARYTSTFTPPAQQFSQLIKPNNFSDYSLLLNFENLTSAELNNPLLQSGDYAKNYVDLPPFWYSGLGEVSYYAMTDIDNTDSKFNTNCGKGVWLYERFEYGLATLVGSITFDCWIKMPSTFTPTGYVYQIFAFDGLWQLGIQTHTHHWFDASTGGIDGGGVSHPVIAETPLFDQWVHYAITMTQTEVGSDYETEIKLYKNGILFLTTTTETGTASACRAYPVRISNYFKCDEVRIRQGLHYTANFTPDTAPVITVDPNWSNTVLLVNFNGSDGSTEIENVAELTKTLTAVGNAQISTAQSKFGGASGYFDGSGDYLTYPHSSDYSANSGDFCVEAWIRPATLSTIRVIATKRPAGGVTDTEWVFCTNESGKLAMVAWNSSGGVVANVVGTTVLTVDTWHHVAMCRQGSTWRLFVDGALDSSGAQSGTVGANTTPLYIGYDASPAGAGRDWNGYIDDLRITRGARYTKAFIPPATETGKMVAGIDPQWDNVSLMLNFNGTNASTTFTDSSSNNCAVTVVGNAQISTAKSRFGGSSALFDGTGDYLNVNSAPAIGTGDFTIEAWVYIANASQSFTLFDCRNADHTNSGFTFYVRYTSKLTFGTGSPFVATEGTTTVSNNTWHHIALVRSSGVIKGYLNGNLEFTVSNSNNMTRTVYRIGSNWNDSGGPSSTGHIDCMRITKSHARYTANFTPSTIELGEVLYTASSLNSQLRFELEAKRGGLTSWMMHNHTVTRA